MAGDLKIRERTRTAWSRPADIPAGAWAGPCTWDEYQLIQGREIIGRFDTLEQAEKRKLELESK